MLILAIESSCDETAAAVVRDGRDILSNIISSQVETHKAFGGVVPEVASRMHTECISDVVERALLAANCTYQELDAVAVTYAPGLIGALLTGLSFAKGLSFSLNIPLIPVHHIRAHAAANYIENRELKPPYLCLIASGGHSHIVLVKDYTDFRIVGRTRDDAAGEAFDKVARILNLSYPGGPSIDRLSLSGNADSFKLPRVSFAERPYDFSFSGVKTSVVNLVHNLRQKNEPLNEADIAASFNKTVCETLADKLIAAAIAFDIKSLALAGGVAANSHLRRYTKELCDRKGLTLSIPSVNFCGDNAAMVGVQGFYEFAAETTAGTSLNAYATMSIESF